VTSIETSGLRARLARHAAAAAIVVLTLLFAAPALGNPAVDEYKLRLPDAKGKDHDHDGGVNPTPTPQALDMLPAPTLKGLKHNKNGKALAAVATAPDLGAPMPTPQSTDGDQSLLGGLLRSLLDPMALLVLLAMAGIAFGGYRAQKLNEPVSAGPRTRSRGARR
jgi:hypothetical protein